MITQDYHYYSEEEQTEYVLTGSPGAYVLIRGSKGEYPITDDAAAEFILLTIPVEFDCE